MDPIPKGRSIAFLCVFAVVTAVLLLQQSKVVALHAKHVHVTFSCSFNVHVCFIFLNGVSI